MSRKLFRGLAALLVCLALALGPAAQAECKPVDLGNGKVMSDLDILKTVERSEAHGATSPATVSTATSRAVTKAESFVSTLIGLVRDFFEAVAERTALLMPGNLSARDRAYMEQVTVPAATATYVASAATWQRSVSDALPEAASDRTWEVTSTVLKMAMETEPLSLEQTRQGDAFLVWNRPGPALDTSVIGQHVQESAEALQRFGLHLVVTSQGNIEGETGLIYGGSNMGGSGGGSGGGRGYTPDTEVPVPPVDWGPEPDFTMPRAACVTTDEIDNPVRVSDASKPGTSPIVSRRWSISGGGKYRGSLSGSGGTLRFLDPGDYCVTLTVRDANGQEASVTKSIRVYPFGVEPDPELTGELHEIVEDPRVHLTR